MFRKHSSETPLTDEQKERKLVVFSLLISLFERAYLLVYEEHMDRQSQRMWQSWEDYMREWCQRRDFREALPELLTGEDVDFLRAYPEHCRVGSRRPPVNPTPVGSGSWRPQPESIADPALFLEIFP